MEKKEEKEVHHTEREKQRESDKKKAKQRIIKIGILVFLIILLLLLLFRCSYDYQQPIPDNRIEQGTIDLPSKDEAQQLVNETVEQGMFQVFMNTDISVTSENEANLLIQNSESNHYSAYVEIYKDNELLYKSDTIQPGYKLEYDKLQKDLDAGAYDCTAYFHVVDTQDNSEINKIGLSVKLTKEIKDQ